MQTLAATNWPNTGITQIDDAHNRLNKLIASHTLDESSVVQALRPVFYLLIFRHIYEDQVDRALFIFCRAQLLLESSVGYFRSGTDRTRIIDATQNLISLQDHLLLLFVRPPRRDFLCEQHQQFTAYAHALPPFIGPTRLEGQAFDKAQYTLGKLRDNLKLVGLMD